MANLSCTQFRSRGVTILCVLHLNYNVALTFRRLENSWNKTFYSQTAFSPEWAQTRSDVLLSAVICTLHCKLLETKFFQPPHWCGTTVSSETSPLNENRLNRVWRFNTNGSFTFLLHLTVLSMCSICLEAPFISRNELDYNYLLQLIQSLEIEWPVISISLLKWHHKLLSQDRHGLHWDPKLSSSLVIRFAHERITVSWNNNSTPALL